MLSQRITFLAFVDNRRLGFLQRIYLAPSTSPPGATTTPFDLPSLFFCDLLFLFYLSSLVKNSFAVSHQRRLPRVGCRAPVSRHVVREARYPRARLKMTWRSCNSDANRLNHRFSVEVGPSFGSPVLTRYQTLARSAIAPSHASQRTPCSSTSCCP